MILTHPQVTAAVAAVLITLLFWAVLPGALRANEQQDYVNFYEPVARGIAAGRGWAPPEGIDFAKTPPGYPLLLAGVFSAADRLGVERERAVDGLSLASQAAAAALIVAIAAPLFGTAGGLAAALVWASYPPVLWLTKQPNSEVPFQVAFLAAFLLLLAVLREDAPRSHLAAGVGVAVGLAMLIRPIAAALGLVSAAVIVAAARAPRGRRLVLAGIVLAGSVLTVGPWEAFVYARTGRVVALTTNSEASFLDGLTFAVASKGYRREPAVPADTRALMAAARHDLLEPGAGRPKPTTGQVVAWLARAARERPGSVALLVAVKAARVFYATDSCYWEGMTAMLQLPYLALIGVAVWRCLAAGGARRLAAQAGLAWAALFWVMAVLGVPILRYMTPALGLLLALTPAALSRWSVRPAGNLR